MTYIIYWLTSLFVSDTCPGMAIKDEFGRSPQTGVSCAVMHGHTDWLEHSKNFGSKDSAMQFMERIKSEENKQSNWIMQSQIKGVKIDSVKN